MTQKGTLQPYSIGVDSINATIKNYLQSLPPHRYFTLSLSFYLLHPDPAKSTLLYLLWLYLAHLCPAVS